MRGVSCGGLLNDFERALAYIPAAKWPQVLPVTRDPSWLTRMHVEVTELLTRHDAL
jgi:hypothetical protein